jgi:hypothetical protein
MIESPQSVVCAACGKPIKYLMPVVEGAVALCDDSACIQKRARKTWKEAHAAQEMRWAEEGLDREPEEEESNVAVRPSGPVAGPWVAPLITPGDAFDRKLERLKIPKHVRAKITTDEARRITPEVARSMTKAQPMTPANNRQSISSSDKDPGIREPRGRKRGRKQLEKEIRDTPRVARRVSTTLS